MEPQRRHWTKVATALLALALALAAVNRWNEPLISALMGSQTAIEAWVDTAPVLSFIAYVLVVCLGKVTPVPGGIALALTGGYLFGTVTGGLASAIGAALSAALVAALGRRFLSDFVDRLAGERLRTLEDATARDGFYYILAARLLPVLPAWLVNLVPVVAPIPIRTVTVATFLGLLPISITLASIGHEISHLGRLADVSLADIDPMLVLPLSALALLALAPVFAKRYGRDKR